MTALSGGNAGLVMTLKKDGSALPPLAMSPVMDNTTRRYDDCVY